MPVPKFYQFMKPLLILLGDGKERPLQTIYEETAKSMGLTDEDKLEKLPSGKKLVYIDRIGWAVTYLIKAGLIKRVKRATFVITDEGSGVLRQNPAIIDVKFLDRFPSFVEFHKRQNRTEQRNENNATSTDGRTPEEILHDVYTQINSNLAEDLLAEISKQSPSFFERMVVDLLKAMGYGDWSKESSSVVGKPGDEGIDGIIKEDKLGFDVIYIQAKKWDPEAVIQRPEIQKFGGALRGKDSKGLFITTAKFSEGATKYAQEQHIVLVDGKTLARLMIEHDLGVSTEEKILIKKIDNDYFEGNL